LFPSHSASDALTRYPCVIKYLLPSPNDKRKVPATLHPMLIVRPENGSVVVGHDEGTLPTSDKKGQKVDYDAFSKSLIPDTVGQEDYILYSAVFGDYVFPKDDDVLRRRSQGLKQDLEIPYKHPFVYRFGITSGFRGILTSLKTFVLVGFGHPPNGKGFDRTKLILHPIHCPLVKVMSDWYRFVGDDCAIQAMIFFCPVVRYSGISNLLTQSKEAAVMQLRVVPMEDGISIPNAINRTETVQKHKVDFSVFGQTAEGPAPVAHTTAGSYTADTGAGPEAQYPSSAAPVLPPVPVRAPVFFFVIGPVICEQEADDISL